MPFCPAQGASPPLTDSALDTNDRQDLPPISDLKAIFKDLVSNVQGDLVKICDTLNGRKLRVGTMCRRVTSSNSYAAPLTPSADFRLYSGTESPLLALGLISDSLEELTGSKLEVEHIFSCEIEPFKQVRMLLNRSLASARRSTSSLGSALSQAYIERNFAPPLLFRDVTELYVASVLECDHQN